MMQTTTDAIKIEADLAARQAESALAHAGDMQITNVGEYRAAVEELKELSARHREVDAKRKEATKPLDEAKKAIMGWFRPALDSLDAGIDTLRRRIAGYNEEQHRAETQAAADAAALIKAGKRDAAEVAVTAAFANSVGDVEGVTLATVWTFEITDAAAIPREYLLVDEKKIRAVVTALKGHTNIPGVRAFPSTQVKVKT